jgi:hypothetical protein
LCRDAFARDAPLLLESTISAGPSDPAVAHLSTSRK